MLSQTAEYALRAVVFLGERHGSAQTTRQIAEATHVPNGYLSKVLQSLNRSGLVRSQRGLHGGFVLARDPNQTSLLDVIRAVDPFRRIHTCPLDLPEHADQLCPLHQRLDDAMALIESTFANTTIAELIADGAMLQPPFKARPSCDGRCDEPCDSACKRAAALRRLDGEENQP